MFLLKRANEHIDEGWAMVRLLNDRDIICKRPDENYTTAKQKGLKTHTYIVYIHTQNKLFQP